LGGAGSAVLETLNAYTIKVPVLQLGLPDRIIHHGDQAQQLASCGLNADGIVASIRARLSR
jgi:1-deoxy-D-xylulose-5-phosphate synthase